MNKPLMMILLLPFFFTGCSSLQFQIGFPAGEDPASFTKYTVKEIKVVTEPVNSVNFGPYSVIVNRTGIKKSENKTDGVLSAEVKNTAAEKYSSELKGLSGETWSAECDSYADYYSKESGIAITRKPVDGYYKNYLQCTFTSGKQQPAEMRLEVNETYKDQTLLPKKGYARCGNVKLDIERTMDTGQASLLPMYLGYYIYHKGKLVAVVQNMIKGTVYISGNLEPELLPLVVNASAAILTHYDLEVEVFPDDDED